ncbi:MAG: hypothetical protein EOP67_65200, partial [Sphingomonas sp.]
MPDLIATRDMRYATRALQAGDPFQASSQDARILIAIKKARPADEQANTTPTEPTIDELRDKAAKLGITVSTRWGDK